MSSSEPAQWVASMARLFALVTSIAITIWILWTTVVVFVGGTIPLTTSPVNSNPVGAIIFLVFGEPIAMTLSYWAWMIVFIPLGLLFRKRSQTATAESRPTFVKHVEMYPGGLGATFYLSHPTTESHLWHWSYDPGTPDDFNTLIETNRAITDMEKELNLPLTHPNLDPDRLPPSVPEVTREQKVAEHEELEVAAADGDVHARVRLWEETGAPVVDPSDLHEGEIYHLGYDLGIYRGVFEGRRWDGFPEFAAEADNVLGRWCTFEAAQETDIGMAGIRIGADKFQESVLKLNAEQGDARATFDVLRREYQEWESQRPPASFF